MLSLIRSLPYVAVVAAVLYGYHYVKINQLEKSFADQKYALLECQNTNAVLRSADQQQKDTIIQLQRNNQQQQESITKLNTEVRVIAQQRDEYLSIFKRHDLTKLSIAKPGLIEPRINSGTRAVFEDLEAQTALSQDTVYETNSNSSDTDPSDRMR